MIIKNHRIEEVDLEFRSDNILIFDFGKKNFFAKVAFKFFKLFGKPITTKEFIVKDKLDDKDIVRYIYDQQAILEHFAKRTPKYLILGSDAMQELKMRTSYGSFVIGDSFDESYIKKRFAGLTVILMPSMTGVLVLHDICETQNLPQAESAVPPVSGIKKI